MIPAFRWLLRLGTPHTAPLTACAPFVAPEPPNETPAAPAWLHRPPSPHERAETCGQHDCDQPVGDHPSGEFCSNTCHAVWLTARLVPTPLNTDPFVASPSPPAPPEPAWMAALTAWERAKAERLIADRKSPGTEAA